MLITFNYKDGTQTVRFEDALTADAAEEKSSDLSLSLIHICTVNIDKSLNYPTGWLVAISVTPEGEQVTAIESKSGSGTINDTATALGDYTPVSYTHLDVYKRQG